MKKLIIKTALITLCGAILCGALLIVILSLAAPAVMMNFTAKMGMESLSGNFAYSEYRRSGDLDCLARSFLIAVDEGDDGKAMERWEVLYADEGFDDYCIGGEPEMDELPDYSYRDYLTGSAARVMYRLATSEEEKGAVLAFAIAETLPAFPAGNPMIALSAEAVGRGDTAFLGMILEGLSDPKFAQNEGNEDFLRLRESLTSHQNG